MTSGSIYNRNVRKNGFSDWQSILAELWTNGGLDIKAEDPKAAQGI